MTADEQDFFDGRVKKWRKESAMVSDEDLKEYLEDNHIPPSAIEELTSELIQLREEARKTCKWETSKEGDIETNCGHGFWQPVHQFKFCPYCGHHIEETP